MLTDDDHERIGRILRRSGVRYTACMSGYIVHASQCMDEHVVTTVEQARSAAMTARACRGRYVTD